MSPVVQYSGSGCGQAGNLQGIKRSIETYQLLDQGCTWQEIQIYVWGWQEKPCLNHCTKEKDIEGDARESAWGMDRNQSLGFQVMSTQVNSKNSFVS